MTFFAKSYFDVSKLVFWTDVTDTQKARLVFSFRDGNPRIVVYTGVTGKDGIINFPSDVPTMTYIVSVLKEIAAGAPGEKQAIQSLTTLYVNDKPTQEKKLVSTLHIGKSKEGLVYLCLVAEDKPKIVFTIKSSIYHTFKDQDGNAIPDSVISVRMTTSIADMILNLISSGIMDYSKEEYSTTRKQSTIKLSAPVSSGSFSGEIEDLAL